MKKIQKNKIHWVRKYKGEDYTNFDSFRWYFDWNTACGRNLIDVDCRHTVIRKNVTCKTCLKIMKKKGMLS